MDPNRVTIKIGQGQTYVHTKRVRTDPAPPPNPDIVFLADTTASMGNEIQNVQNNVRAIMDAVRKAQPNAQFGVAQYKDVEDDPDFKLDQAVTNNDEEIQRAVETWSAHGGEDEWEAQLPALHELAVGGTGWRPDSTRIIVWFGDAAGHDPRKEISLEKAKKALKDKGIRVIAVSTGTDKLDQTGQATEITEATGGLLRSGVNADDLTTVILDGLKSIPVVITPQVRCNEGLSVTFPPPGSQTVERGQDAVFTQTIAVAPNAPAGTTLSCEVDFEVDGKAPGPEFKEVINVQVPPLQGGPRQPQDDCERIAEEWLKNCGGVQLPPDCVKKVRVSRIIVSIDLECP